jgi:dihydropteroate synthase
MENVYTPMTTINLNGELFDLSRPRVMGILNITPDSFYDGGAYAEEKDLRQRVQKMVNEGVDIIDVGAYSSRPGAVDISVKEELERLTFALPIIRDSAGDLPISVDTFRSEVAAFVLEHYHVEIINDISGGDLDDKMFDVVAHYGAAYMMMHMRGTPQTMTPLTTYNNMVAEILRSFSSKIRTLKSKGLNDIIIDPGFGFAKNLDQNYQLLSQLHLFNALQVPLLVGVSRKSMIFKLLQTTPQESLNGTTAAHMLALTKGAKILRVHDVKEAKECVAIYQKTME